MNAGKNTGAVLLLCLLLLMALSLLGLAAASDSQMQQRASGNMQQDLADSVAAGMTLGWAEAWLLSLPGDSRPLPCAAECDATEPIRPAGHYPNPLASQDTAWWQDHAVPAGHIPGGDIHGVTGMPDGHIGYWLVEEAHYQDWPESESGVSGLSWYRVTAMSGLEAGGGPRLVESVMARPWGDSSFSNPPPNEAATGHFCTQLPAGIPCSRQAWQELN